MCSGRRRVLAILAVYVIAAFTSNTDCAFCDKPLTHSHFYEYRVFDVQIQLDRSDTLQMG